LLKIIYKLSESDKTKDKKKLHNSKKKNNSLSKKSSTKKSSKKKKPSIVESRYDPSMAELIDIIHMPSVYEEFVIYLSAKNKKQLSKVECWRLIKLFENAREEKDEKKSNDLLEKIWKDYLDQNSEKFINLEEDNQNVQNSKKKTK